MSDIQMRDRDPDDPAVHYKPIHGLAVTALVLSLFSLLTAAFPGLLFVNVITVAIAVTAMLRINRSQRHVGLNLARLALFLAVLSAAFSLTYNLGRTAYLNQVARRHSRLIGELLMEGRYAEAFEYSIRPQQRKPQGTDLQEFYRIPDKPDRPPPGLDLLAWITQPPISVIEEDRRRGKLRFLGFGRYPRPDPFVEASACIYRYEPQAPELEPSTFQMIMLRRKFKGSLDVSWQLYFLDILAGPQAEEKMVQIGGPPADEEQKEE
jgi:hypothetical protein